MGYFRLGYLRVKFKSAHKARIFQQGLKLPEKLVYNTQKLTTSDSSLDPGPAIGRMRTTHLYVKLTQLNFKITYIEKNNKVKIIKYEAKRETKSVKIKAKKHNRLCNS